MNEKDLNTDLNDEELTEEQSDAFKVEDKRRFNEDGERINVEIMDDSGSDLPIADSGNITSPEIIRLENELETVRTRCQVAETKLVDVQKRFDEAKGNLEKETSEMRQRLMKTLEQRAQQAQFNFLTTLLPVLDNLNLAIGHAQDDSSLENLLEGVRGTARSFEQALISVGVQPVSSVGSKFDPEQHEAVDMTEVEADKDETITSEYSRGYLFGDRLLRPARVQVGKASAQQEAGAD